MYIASGIALLISIFLIQGGCGVKSKPLPPLKEPWISTGDWEKDREKKAKQKKAQSPSEGRIEFVPPPNPSEKIEP